jgi:hypothetical protein
MLRDGSLPVLDLFQMGGVVTFPSFHAAAAVLYAGALWPVRWIRWLALLPNAAMLVAKPIGGRHFLADVIAGIIVAGLSIVAACRIGSVLASAPAAVTPLMIYLRPDPPGTDAETVYTD